MASNINDIINYVSSINKIIEDTTNFLVPDLIILEPIDADSQGTYHNVVVWIKGKRVWNSSRRLFVPEKLKTSILSAIENTMHKVSAYSFKLIKDVQINEY